MLTPLYPNWENREAAVVRIRSSVLPLVDPDGPVIYPLAACLKLGSLKIAASSLAEACLRRKPTAVFPSMADLLKVISNRNSAVNADADFSTRVADDYALGEDLLVSARCT